MKATLEETLSKILDCPVGFVKLTYQSSDRFESVSMRAPNWVFVRGRIDLTLEFQTTTDPATLRVNPDIWLLSAAKLGEKPRGGDLGLGSGMIVCDEPVRWWCRATLLSGPTTDKILQSLLGGAS